jgi:hypothetical protein
MLLLLLFFRKGNFPLSEREQIEISRKRTKEISPFRKVLENQ